ncbi:MAG: Phage capsid family protein [Proteobacteria bacterium]|nr:Phage capsid family protein [Pseudomonadota bacterium]
MSQKLKDLREQRGKLVHDARTIIDRADAEKRALTAEEDGKYKELFSKQEEVRSQIEREEQMAEVERQTAEAALRNKDAGKKEDTGAKRTTGLRGTDEYRASFNRFLAGGRAALSETELRALQSDSDSAGGFMVASEQFVDQLIQAVDDAVFIRQRATKFRVASAQSLGAPALAADPADADWTAEILTGSEDGTMSFGKRELTPNPLAKRAKVSNKLLRQMPRVDALVIARLAYKFAISQEKAFMTGSGANQPLGIFTASNDGITTARDVATGNAATAPTFDGLISAKFGLKGQYWNKAEWLFHRDVLAVVAKLKDGDGQYLWRESVRAGEPDRLLNLPVMMSEYAPNTLTANLYVGALGDFSHYWIADALDMQVQRLVELYAETNQTGFIGRLETDGMPTLAEAFVRVKLAAS